MTNYKIKLASNFQTVEFDLFIEPEEALTIDDPRIADAVELVNKLGEVVENTIKSKEPVKVTKTPVQEEPKEELATEGQKKYLKGLGLPFTEKTTKREAWKMIQEHKK